MRPFIVSFCALAGVLSFTMGAYAAGHHVKKHPAQKRVDSHVLDSRAQKDVARLNALHRAGCLGGILNEDPAVNYLTLGDYPAYATAPGERRTFICGDKKPPFVRWTNYNSVVGLTETHGMGHDYHHGH